MLRPKTTANINTGVTTYTASVGPSRPNKPAPNPSWNTSTTIPNAAATEREFNTTALIGTRIERNATRSMIAVIPSTRAMIVGNTARRFSCRSRLAAENPPTSISTESRLRTPFAAIPRIRRTTSVAPAYVVLSARLTIISVVRPSGDTYASKNSGYRARAALRLPKSPRYASRDIPGRMFTGPFTVATRGSAWIESEKRRRPFR